MKNEVVKNSPYFHEYPKGLQIPFSYYSNLLDNYLLDNSERRIIICCDDFNNKEYLKQFEKYSNICYADYDTLTQFQIIRNSKTIILPNSSFGRGAILLSNVKDLHLWLGEKDSIKDYSLDDYLKHPFL